MVAASVGDWRKQGYLACVDMGYNWQITGSMRYSKVLCVFFATAVTVSVGLFFFPFIL